MPAVTNGRVADLVHHAPDSKEARERERWKREDRAAKHEHDSHWDRVLDHVRKRAVGAVVRADGALRLEHHVAAARILVERLVDLHVGAQVTSLQAHDHRLVNHWVVVDPMHREVEHCRRDERVTELALGQFDDVFVEQCGVALRVDATRNRITNDHLEECLTNDHDDDNPED